MAGAAASRLVAVVDVGKTNTKLTLVEPGGRTVWQARRPSRAITADGLSQLDVGGTAAWLRHSLAEAPERARIGWIVPVAHGGAAVLLDAQGDVICAPDYEDAIYDSVAAAYRPERDPFACTLSPDMPLGLNVGRQLFYLQTQRPELFARVRHIVPYAQFWAFLLCGVLASEITSVACHTDLWQPLEATFSALAVRRGWAACIPPMRRAGAALGCVTAPLAAQTGLDPGCTVLCGLHDSNASYLRHVLSQPDGARFAVVSSGTWCIVMAAGVDAAALTEQRGMLANVDVFGRPVATGRVMGGREYELIAGSDAPPPSLDALSAVLDRGSLALPAFARGGLFGDRPGRLLDAEGLDDAGRAAVATLYLALMTDAVLDGLGAGGPAIVDGPLVGNAAFAAALGALRADPVLLAPEQSGAVAAARYLACGDISAPGLQPVSLLDDGPIRLARQRWRRLVSDNGGPAQSILA